MSSASFINPYELLGVTIDTNKDELKRRYYELSLIMHPDKGGSDEDMRSLHAAYKFVLNEISNIDRETTVEQLEKEFKEFCSAQENAIPKFQDIFADAFDLPKFNEYFEATKQNYADESWMKASMDDGYGSMMERSEFARTEEDKNIVTNVTYKDTETGTVTNDFQAVALYQNNISEQGCNANAYDLTVGNKGLDNYSSAVGGLEMGDYREAFTSVDPATFPNQEPKQRTLEDLKREREETNYCDDKQVKDVTWSFEGFINKARKKVSNILRLS